MRMVANVAIDPRGVRPIRFDGDDVESVLFDQSAGDRRARSVELRRAMCRLAEKDNLRIRETVENRAEIRRPVRLWQRLAKRANDSGCFIRARCGVVVGMEELRHAKTTGSSARCLMMTQTAPARASLSNVSPKTLSR